MAEKSRIPLRTALRIAGVYLVLCTAWIVFSDRALESLAPDPDLYRTLQTWKGTIFVVASALLIFFLVLRELSRARHSEDLYRGLVEQSLAGIYVIRSNRFLFVTQRFAQTFGYSAEEMLESLTVEDIVAPEDRERVMDNLNRRERGEVEALQYRLTGLTRSGERIRVQVHGRRASWRGKPAVLGLSLDVTQQEHLEKQLQKAQEMEAMGRLTGAVAHDFNNFLGAVLGSLELMETQLSPDHPVIREIRVAEEAIDKAADLTRQLLTFSRQRVFEAHPTDLNRLVSQMEPVLRRLEGNRMELRLELGEEVPPVRIDPSRFEQVLANLVLNGIQASDDHGVIAIRTKAGPRAGAPPAEGKEAPPPSPAPGSAAPGNSVEDQDLNLERGAILEVEDQGCGMDLEILDDIFQPFFTTKAEGTGLGLSTVHGIVKQAGGRIQAESRPGEGSLFRIQLPPSPEPVTGRDEPVLSAGEPRASREEATIVLLDGDEAMRSVVSRFLQAKGYGIIQATRGDEVLQLLEENGDRADLLLADVELPDTDGVTLYGAARERSPGLKALFTSAHASEELVERLDRDEPIQLLEKPFGLDELLLRIEEILDTSSEED